MGWDDVPIAQLSMSQILSVCLCVFLCVCVCVCIPNLWTYCMLLSCSKCGPHALVFVYVGVYIFLNLQRQTNYTAVNLRITTTFCSRVERVLVVKNARGARSKALLKMFFKWLHGRDQNDGKAGRRHASHTNEWKFKSLLHILKIQASTLTANEISASSDDGKKIKSPVVEMRPMCAPQARQIINSPSSPLCLTVISPSCPLVYDYISSLHSHHSHLLFSTSVNCLCPIVIDLKKKRPSHKLKCF